MIALRPQLDAEIVPDRGLGGLALRTRLADLDDLDKAPFEMASPFEARYRVGDGECEVAVDVRNGKVFKLTAREGYRGRLFGKIGVGMTVRQAMAIEPRLVYDEAEELIRCEGVEGLALDVPDIDPPPEAVPDMVIAAISVFAREIETEAGQAGRW